jgi:8-oxo-dGTP pyrophosphatase MutT (NUDIX family)
MDSNKNPFHGQNAVPLDKYLLGCTEEQMSDFLRKRKHDPNFDWRLRLATDAESRDAGIAWAATWEGNGSKITPYVILDENGLALFIRPCAEFRQFVQVVPLRYADGGLWEIGVVFQKRPFAATAEHPDCSIMAGLSRGLVDEGETPEAAAIREIREEMGCTINGDQLVLLGEFNADSSYIATYGTVFAAFVGDRDPALQLDTKEQIVDIHWYSLSKLISLIGTVSVEDCEARGTQEVNFAGAIDFYGLFMVLAMEPKLRAATVGAFTFRR